MKRNIIVITVALVVLVIFFIGSNLTDSIADGAEKEIYKGTDCIDESNSKKIREIMALQSDTLKKDAESVFNDDDRKAYNDSQGNCYLFNKENEFVGYMMDEIEDDYGDKAISMTKAKSMAQTYFSEVTDKTYYKLVEFEYYKDTNTFKAIYKDVYNDIETTDCITIFLDSDGQLLSFTVHNQGYFQDIDQEVDFSKAKDKVETALKEKYGDTMLQFDIDQYYLDVNEEGKLYFDVFVSIEIKNELGLKEQIPEEMYVDVMSD